MISEKGGVLYDQINCGEPDADRLAGNRKLARNFSLSNVLIEERGRSEPPLFHPGEITPGSAELKVLAFMHILLCMGIGIVSLLCENQQEGAVHEKT